nr:MAG TPA: hypothetical protein [Caudoviricetes sp.]
MALTAKKVYAILKRQISDMEAKLNSPVRYRGTVATADLLPLNPDIGDMYNIESKSVYGEAGMNVAWNGVVWDTMGAPIDMSLYLTKEEAETVIQRLVTEYFEKNPVKPGATTEQARQIEQNKTDIGSLKEDLTSKADKTSLAQTDRKLDALWKLNQGISYEFQTDEAEAYQKTVPSGAKVANVKSIGGKTIVWNQLLANTSFNNVIWNGLTINGNSKDGITITGTASTNNNKNIGSVNIIKNHKYLVYGIDKSIIVTDDDTFSTQAGNRIFTATNSKQSNISFYVKESSEYNAKNYPMLFDLTQMFGSGNEPSTPEEFEAMFPADYYPYNAGELMSAPVNEVVEQGRNLLHLKNTSSGIASTYEEGTVQIKGTATNTWQSFEINPLPNSGTFTFSNNNNNFTITLEYKHSSGERELYRIAKGTKSVTFERTDDREVTGYFILIEGLTRGTVYDATLLLQIEEGSAVTTYSPYRKTSYPIPQAILNLPGYGWSAGDVRNEVDWENKQYIQRVGKADLGTFTWVYYANRFNTSDPIDNAKPNGVCLIIPPYYWNKNDFYLNKNFVIYIHDNRVCYIYDSRYDSAEAFKQAINGVMLYYELAEPIVTDITDIIGDTFQEPIEVEAGGTLTFKNSNGDNYRIPVPSTEEYLVSLAEVAK